MSSQQILESLKAEALLGGSHVMGYISTLTRQLSHASDGRVISYEDMYSALATEVDALPKLRLELSVPPGGESQYSIQLTMAMETVADDCDRVSSKVSLFESRVCDALGRLKRVHGEFGAWYALAAGERLAGTEIRLAMAQVKQLADSEFSRLTDGLDITMESMLNAVKLLRGEIKGHKRTQMDKYNMGKDQVNASWTSHMPVFNNSGDITMGGLGKLLETRSLPEEAMQEEPMEEEPEEAGSPPDIRGTFFKAGDARPVHPVASDIYGEGQ